MRNADESEREGKKEKQRRKTNKVARVAAYHSRVHIGTISPPRCARVYLSYTHPRIYTHTRIYIRADTRRRRGTGDDDDDDDCTENRSPLSLYVFCLPCSSMRRARLCNRGEREKAFSLRAGPTWEDWLDKAPLLNAMILRLVVTIIIVVSVVIFSLSLSSFFHARSPARLSIRATA